MLRPATGESFPQKGIASNTHSIQRTGLVTITESAQSSTQNKKHVAITGRRSSSAHTSNRMSDSTIAADSRYGQPNNIE